METLTCWFQSSFLPHLKLLTTPVFLILFPLMPFTDNLSFIYFCNNLSDSQAAFKINFLSVKLITSISISNAQLCSWYRCLLLSIVPMIMWILMIYTSTYCWLKVHTCKGYVINQWSYRYFNHITYFYNLLT